MARRLVLAGLLMAGTPAMVAAQAVQNVVLRNSFNPVGAGARGLGMGGAFIAVADDGTAASFIPPGWPSSAGASSRSWVSTTS